MRQKRAKAYRKLMHLYSMSFGFRQPYQVLVDSEMCKSAVTQKLDFAKQLHTVLQGEIKPMITQCCIHELYLQGKTQQPAVDLAKNFERRKCNHREAIPGDECLESVVGDKNKHRYVIATQSHPLRVKLRSIPATPIVHINRSVMVLEPPSDITLRAKLLTEEQSLHATGQDLSLVDHPASEERPKKRKGPKGPNPLSVKKKKPNTVDTRKDKGLVAATAVTMGSKRKAEESEGEADEDDLVGSAIQNEISLPDSAAKKRRKRRRKNHTASGASIETSEVHVNT
ncbi:hypothetical protein GALMADRAFT_83644 [Galerina marginata CBS 339.88]|uniref:U three protein 23 n=1 Tax=Galerina marginata (strain CBS 339.88) TaxID=685588 RepID=A0A067TYT5_GALM3|nr:hypothetical protein GALMADRAFT_83644 [Galerina marginata CBS 339.88]